mgnify:CR=1 FL=1
MSDIQVGDSASLEFVVGDDDTARALGSGDVPVLATPRAIAWVEAASCAAIADRLLPQETSVGITVSVDHQAATAVGGRVEAAALLAEEDRRRAMIDVALVNEDGATAMSGVVQRLVVDRDQFLGS